MDPSPNPSPTDEAYLDHTAAVLSILAHPLRLKIYLFVRDRQRAFTPSIIGTQLGLRPSTTSASLRRMSELGILTRTVSGRFTFYDISPQFLTNMRSVFK